MVQVRRFDRELKQKGENDQFEFEYVPGNDSESSTEYLAGDKSWYENAEDEGVRWSTIRNKKLKKVETGHGMKTKRRGDRYVFEKVG